MNEIKESGFSVQKYRSILEMAIAEDYQIITFDDLEGIGDDQKYCVLRHDVDADLSAASLLASVESDLGVTSTYFLMISSPVYNLFSRFSRRYVHEIIEKGHKIGLHFDAYNCHENDLRNKILLEKEILEKMFAVKINVVSFHQPDRYIIEKQISLKDLKNTYNSNDMKQFKYISDSNMVWRSGRPDEIFKKKPYKNIQFLFHPMWWVYSNNKLNTNQVWNEVIRKNYENCQEQLVRFERAFGLKRTIEVKEIR